MIKTLRNLSLWLLPALSAASSILHLLFPTVTLLDWLFKISLSGTVGIWTNYFAIKMLFRPKHRTIFGIQGMIPANRKQLAEAIGQAVAEELLDPDQVFSFIEKQDVIKRLGSEALGMAHRELDKPERRAWLEKQAGRLLQKATAENIEDFLAAAVSRIKLLAGDRLSFTRIWLAIRDELEVQLSSGPLHDAIGGIAMKLAKLYSPDAAEWINDQIDEYIESQSWAVRQALKLGKWAFRVNEATITDYISCRVESPDFGPSVLRAIESMAPEVARLMENPKLRKAASGYFDSKKQALTRWLETEGLARGKTAVLEALDSEKFWDAIHRQIDKGIPALVTWAQAKFDSPGFRDQTTPFLRQLASHIPVAAIVEDRVDSFDLDDLERLIYKVTSENLAGIEFLGGVLGCIAGFILINPLFGIVIVLAGGILWLFGRSAFNSSSKRKSP
ncbi:MAG TPA: DUF445 family protein [Syntrophobacteraceae bacterium]|jgi:uncharacterized membrane protein YheB (UPF0754 family)|nr:DUF445 family protein [Syntrophobacteraceae bacterium]